MKNVMKNAKAMVMVFVAMIMIGAAGTAQASLYLDGNSNYPSVVSTEEYTYYIDISSATRKSSNEFAACFITEDCNGNREYVTYQFLDESVSYWSTPNSSSWHRIDNRTMWMLHNSAKNHAR